MRKEPQSQQSQRAASIDIHGWTARKGSGAIAVVTEVCGANSSTFSSHWELQCDIDHTSTCLKSIVLSSLFESVSLWPWGWIVWQVSAVILACLLWTGRVRRWCRAPVSPLPVKPGGGRGAGAEGQLGEGPFSCRAASPGPALPAPSSPPLHARAADWQLSSSCGTCTPATHRW